MANYVYNSKPDLIMPATAPFSLFPSLFLACWHANNVVFGACGLPFPSFIFRVAILVGHFLSAGIPFQVCWPQWEQCCAPPSPPPWPHEFLLFIFTYESAQYNKMPFHSAICFSWRRRRRRRCRHFCFVC